MTAASLWLGRHHDGTRSELPLRALLRHVMALGSSGSGKTVLCKVIVEEVVQSGIPVICVDPQGDLCSLVSQITDPTALIEHGIDPDVAAEFARRVDVVIFTPASTKGVPLCADPVDPKLGRLPAGERLHALTRTAAMVTSLLGFDVDSDDGAGLVAVLDRVLAELLEAGTEASLAALADALLAHEPDGFAKLARYLDPKKLRTACQRLARLDVGARRLLFHEGVPIDIDVLLGRDETTRSEGRIRVSVIYLNTLANQDDKDFVVAALADRLYSWMLEHPSPDPQAMFYIDEVSPFIPPVRKPACKEGLQLLFKQARKYGVCCLMATQNPGDVDYRAMAQFGTWALGRLTTRQDLKKIEPSVKSLDPVHADALLASLPQLRPGQFTLLSPDHFSSAVALQARWLFTDHQTFDEERIERVADELWRDRFAPLAGRKAPVASDEPAPPQQARVSPAIADVDEQGVDEDRFTPIPPTVDDPEAPPLPTAMPSSPLPAVVAAASPPPPPPAPPAPASPPAPPAPLPSAREGFVKQLARRKSMTVAEFAQTASVGEKKARSVLKELVALGLAGQFKEGRVQRFWALSSGARPDIGLPAKVVAVVPRVDTQAAVEIARDNARRKMLGLLGDDEQVSKVVLVHRLLYKVDFRETVERSLLYRVVGAGAEERIGSVYFHPHTLDVLVLSPKDGIRFLPRPAERASDVADLDGIAAFTEVSPVDLALDDRDWTARRSSSDVRRELRARFAAEAERVTELFLPLWEITLQQEGGARFRVVTIDGVVGRPVTWSKPS